MSRSLKWSGMIQMIQGGNGDDLIEGEDEGRQVESSIESTRLNNAQFRHPRFSQAVLKSRRTSFPPIQLSYCTVQL